MIALGAYGAGVGERRASSCMLRIGSSDTSSGPHAVEYTPHALELRPHEATLPRAKVDRITAFLTPVADDYLVVSRA